MYTQYTKYFLDDTAANNFVSEGKPKPEYSVGEVVDVCNWIRLEKGFVIEDIRWIYHDRLCRHCWGYRVSHPKGQTTGLTFLYIPEGYLRKHTEDLDDSPDDSESITEEIPNCNSNIEQTRNKLKPGFRFLDYPHAILDVGDEVCLGLDGKPVSRGPNKYPYNYDPFVIFMGETFERSDSYVYSDRMMQKNRDKFSNACRAVWGDDSLLFRDRTPEDIEKFLTMYFDYTVELTLIMECCNAVTGYPYWMFALRHKEN